MDTRADDLDTLEDVLGTPEEVLDTCVGHTGGFVGPGSRSVSYRFPARRGNLKRFEDFS